MKLINATIYTYVLEKVDTPLWCCMESCTASHVSNDPAPMYIGQTGRSLDHHLREYHQALKNTDLGSSALA